MAIITQEDEGVAIPYNCSRQVIEYAESHGADMRIDKYTRRRFFINLDRTSKRMIDREWATESTGK